jgi:hypothetical protein
MVKIKAAMAARYIPMKIYIVGLPFDNFPIGQLAVIPGGYSGRLQDLTSWPVSTTK